MSAEKVIYELLKTNVALVAVVPVARMFSGVIPIGAVRPALVYNLVSDYEETAIGLTTIKNRARVQVTAVADTYPAVKALAKLITTACNHRQGTYNGVVTDSVIKDGVSADYRDDVTGVFYSTVDFRVAYD
jgi:hypothetical protein